MQWTESLILICGLTMQPLPEGERQGPCAICRVQKLYADSNHYLHWDKGRRKDFDWGGGTVWNYTSSSEQFKIYENLGGGTCPWCPLVPTPMWERYTAEGIKIKYTAAPLVVNLPTCSRPDYAINPAHFETGYARMCTFHGHRARLLHTVRIQVCYHSDDPSAYTPTSYFSTSKVVCAMLIPTSCSLYITRPERWTHYTLSP